MGKEGEAVNVGTLAQKRPGVAAILVLSFGPFGFFYLGWQPVVAYWVVLSVFWLVLELLGFGGLLGLWWARLIVCAFLAYKAHGFVRAAQRAMLTGQSLDEFGGALRCWILAISDAMVGVAMGLAAAGGLLVSYNTIVLQGKVVRGVGFLLIGTPGLVWTAGLLFGVVATGIEAVVFATRRHGAAPH